MATPIRCDQCPVADRAVCAVLQPDERAALARSGRHRRFRRGETILAAGSDTAGTLYGTLVSGAAKLSAIDREGTERIVALIHPAGMLGQIFSVTASLSVIALTDSEACLFPRSRFEALTSVNSALARRLLEEALAELDASRSLIDLISRRSATARVAALLMGLARGASPVPCHGAEIFELPLTRGEMAQLLGVTIETVSRTLTALERDGLIARHGTHGIAITDAAGLTARIG